MLASCVQYDQRIISRHHRREPPIATHAGRQRLGQCSAPQIAPRSRINRSHYASFRGECYDVASRMNIERQAPYAADACDPRLPNT